MIPILFEAQTKDFSSNGIGRLADCVSCQVTEERNGKYEVIFKYPLTGSHYAEITDDRIVYTTHDNSGDKQPFIIYAKSAPINGIVTFYARHVSYGLSDVIVKPFTASSISSALNKLRTAAMTDQPFTFWTDKSTTADFKVKIPSSVKSVLGGTEGSILDTFGGGEYEFDNYTVKLHANRGSDNGVTVRYGKNLTNLLQTHNVGDSYNTIIPYWTDTEGTVVYGNPVVAIGRGSKKYHGTWTEENDVQITDENGNALEFDYYLNHAVTMSFIDKFSDVPTKKQLQDAASAYLLSNEPWLPLDNIKFNFVDLWGSGEHWQDDSDYLMDAQGNYILDEDGGRIALYKNFVKADLQALESVRLCDTVTVVYTALGISAKAKVIKTVWNPLMNRYDSLEMGDPRTTFSEAINKGTRTLLKDYSTTSEMESAIDDATSLITGGMGGHVVFEYDADGKPTEIFVMDTADTDTAVNVLRINVNGIGFSHHGIGGPFETAWTLDGHFVADFIDTGILNANRVRAGTLASTDGSSYWDLDGSVFRFYDKQFDSYVELDEGFIKFVHDDKQFGKIVRMINNDEDVLTICGADYDTLVSLKDYLYLKAKTYLYLKANDYVRISGSNNIQMYSGQNNRSVIRIYDDGTYKFIDLNSGGDTWVRIDGKDDYIRMQTNKLTINGYAGYDGTFTVDGKTLTFRKGILTGVS